MMEVVVLVLVGTIVSTSALSPEAVAQSSQYLIRAVELQRSFPNGHIFPFPSFGRCFLPSVVAKL